MAYGTRASDLRTDPFIDALLKPAHGGASNFKRLGERAVVPWRVRVHPVINSRTRYANTYLHQLHANDSKFRVTFCVHHQTPSVKLATEPTI